MRVWLLALLSCNCGGDDAERGSGKVASAADGGVATGAPAGRPSTAGGAVSRANFAEAAASAWCSYLDSCDALREEQPTLADCTEYWVDRFGSYAGYSQERGLSYDATCVEHFFRELDVRGCGEDLLWFYEDEFRCRCNAYVGTLAEGEACEPVGIDGFDPCEQGLRC